MSPATTSIGLVDLLLTLIGSAVLFDLAEHLGNDPERAADLVHYAIEAVLDRARTTKEMP